MQIVGIPGNYLIHIEGSINKIIESLNLLNSKCKIFRSVAGYKMMSENHIPDIIKQEKISSTMLCRICATEHTNDCLNNLQTSTHNGLYFVDMLQECLQRSISNDFPMNICLDCTSNLIMVYNFHLMCNDSDKKFREMFCYHLECDDFEQKVEVIIDESDSGVKQSHFIDCTAIGFEQKVECRS